MSWSQSRKWIILGSATLVYSSNTWVCIAGAEAPVFFRAFQTAQHRLQSPWKKHSLSYNIFYPQRQYVLSFCWMPNQWFSVSRLWAVGCMLWASPRWCAGVCAVLYTLTWTLASCMRRSSGPTHAWRLGTVMGLWPTVLQWRLDFNRLRLWWKKLSVLALDKKK